MTGLPTKDDNLWRVDALKGILRLKLEREIELCRQNADLKDRITHLEKVLSKMHARLDSRYVTCSVCSSPVMVPVVSISSSPPNIKCTNDGCGNVEEYFTEETWPGYWIPLEEPLREWHYSPTSRLEDADEEDYRMSSYYEEKDDDD